MGVTSGPVFYRLAGQIIQFDREIPELRPFRLDPVETSPFPAGFNPQKLNTSSPASQAFGWLANSMLTVSVWREEQGYRLDIPSAGEFWVSADGSAIGQISRAVDVPPVFLAESWLGPPLVLALALRGIWCLHASAIQAMGKQIAFLGSSGAGKSTLAAYIASQPGAQRAADDILPVAWQDGCLVSLPHFPQLKISTERQPGPKMAEKMPLTALYLLEESPDVSLEAVGSGSAAVLLAAHTVAARLFDTRLLTEHLTFCTRAASIPLRRLAYPREVTALPLVWQALQEDLTALHG